MTYSTKRYGTITGPSQKQLAKVKKKLMTKIKKLNDRYKPVPHVPRTILRKHNGE